MLDAGRDWTAEPGWYPDPLDSRRDRYWDGEAWSTEFPDEGVDESPLEASRRKLNRLLFELRAERIFLDMMGRETSEKLDSLTAAQWELEEEILRQSPGPVSPPESGPSNEGRHAPGKSYRCASCGESIEMKEPSMVCGACGTRNRLPDNEPEAFDAKVDRLGRGGDGFLGWTKTVLNVGGTTATWANLERIEELPLEESRYWQMSDHDRALEGRKWGKLASLELPRPNKEDRLKLVKLFGGTSRAKSFVTWTRLITPEGCNESLRWVRCDHCGHDLVCSAFCVGLLACEQCGASIDVTVYGDETFGKHMTMRSRMNYNRLPRITGRKLIPFMPDVEIVRPSAHRGR